MIKVLDKDGTILFGFTLADVLEMLENPRTIDLPPGEIKRVIFTMGESHEEIMADLKVREKDG